MQQLLDLHTLYAGTTSSSCNLHTCSLMTAKAQSAELCQRCRWWRPASTAQCTARRQLTCHPLRQKLHALLRTVKQC